MSNNISIEKLNNLNIQELVTQTQALVQKKFVRLLVVTFISTITCLFSFGILIGMMTINLFSIVKKLDEEPDYEPAIEDLFKNMDRFVNATLLFLIFVGVGIVINVVLSFILSLSFITSIICYTILTPIYFLSYLNMINDPGLGPVDCFTKAFDTVKASPKNSMITGLIMGIALAIPSWFGFILSVPLHTLAQSFNTCLAWKFYKNITGA